MRPLDGVRVLDLSRLLPGPWCTQVLADFGADVVKVEEPSQGDYSRSAPPFYESKSAYFMNVNRNKRSVTLDLKADRGRELFLELAEEADVVFESFRPGVADRLGVGYDDVSDVNEDVVYCSLSGFGSSGPAKEYAGHDLNITGMTGLLRIHGSEPRMPAVQAGDYGGATAAAIGILLALLHRERGGSGQHVDAAMFDGLLSWMTPAAVDAFAGDGDPDVEVWGNSPRYNVYRTADDEYVTVSLLEEKFWRRFCRLVGREDLVNESESVADRLTDHGELRETYESFLTETFAQRTREEWVRELQARDVPCAPVNSVEEMMADDHVRERGMVREVEDEDEGRVYQLGPPVSLSETPARIDELAPDLGEHTEAVLAELGYDEADLRRFAENAVTAPEE